MSSHRARFTASFALLSLAISGHALAQGQAMSIPLAPPAGPVPPTQAVPDCVGIDGTNFQSLDPGGPPCATATITHNPFGPDTLTLWAFRLAPNTRFTLFLTQDPRLGALPAQLLGEFSTTVFGQLSVGNLVVTSEIVDGFATANPAASASDPNGIANPDPDPSDPNNLFPAGARDNGGITIPLDWLRLYQAKGPQSFVAMVGGSVFGGSAGELGGGNVLTSIAPIQPIDFDGDGILDDGDGSGVIGDSRCPAADGSNNGCDDNCTFFANADQLDQGGAVAFGATSGGGPDGIGNACQCADAIAFGLGQVNALDSIVVALCTPGPDGQLPPATDTPAQRQATCQLAFDNPDLVDTDGDGALTAADNANLAALTGFDGAAFVAAIASGPVPDLNVFAVPATLQADDILCGRATPR